jgi:hypothetical protein
MAFNIRRRFGDDEMMAEQRGAAGIGAALNQYVGHTLRERELETAERNEMAGRGARVLQTPERRNGIQRIADRLRGRGQQTGEDLAGQMQPGQRDGLMVDGRPGPAAAGAFARGAEIADRARGRAAGISDMLREDEVVYEGRGGRKYAVDPMRGAKREAELTRETTRQGIVLKSQADAENDRRTLELEREKRLFEGTEWDRRQGVEHTHKLALQQQSQADRIALERLRQSGRGNSTEARELELRLREATVALQQNRFEFDKQQAGLSSLERSAANATRAVPTGTDRLLTDSAAVAQAESAAARANRSVDSARRGLFGDALQPAPVPAPAPSDSPYTRSPRPTSGQGTPFKDEDARFEAAYRQLQSEGLKRPEIIRRLRAAGFDVEG